MGRLRASSRGSAAGRALLHVLPYPAVAIGLDVFHSAWGALLGYHACMGAAIAVAGRGPWSLRRGWNGRAGAVAGLVAAANGVAFAALWPMIGRADHGLDAGLDAVGLRGQGLALFALWYVIVHPVLEEAFWRGTLYTDARRLAPADVAFAGYHALVLPLFIRPAWVVVAFVVLTAAGFAFRRLAARYGGLAVPVVAHAAAGAGTMAAACWLAGAGSGP